MKRWIILAGLIVILAGCSGKDKEGHNQALSFSSASNLIGKWEQVSATVETDALGKGKQGQIIEVDGLNWDEQMHVNTIRTFFKEDHTYMMEFRNAQDSLVNVQEGHWELTGDSLFLDQTRPKWASYEYKLSLDHQKVELQSILDWDGDGQKDDLYSGVQKKIY